MEYNHRISLGTFFPDVRGLVEP